MVPNLHMFLGLSLHGAEASCELRNLVNPRLMYVVSLKPRMGTFISDNKLFRQTVAGVDERDRLFMGGSSCTSVKRARVDIPISTPPLDLLVIPGRLG